VSKNFVVSPNYRNRSSAFGWLVRRYDEPIQKAVACEKVTCKNVVFEESNRYERGFGCNTVAVCEEVQVRCPETVTDLPNAPISTNGDYKVAKFDGLNICRTTPVAKADKMELLHNGHMYFLGETTDLTPESDSNPSPFQHPNTSASSGMGIPKH